MTAEELIQRAAACRTCGNAHAYRWIESTQASWAADDGHPYRPVVDEGVVALLEYLATGIYTDPWQLPAERPAVRAITNAVVSLA